jgi:hypothetical protein
MGGEKFMAPHQESFSRNFTGRHRDVHYFVMLLGESLYVTDCFRPKLLLAAIQNHGFPAFTDTNKGLLTCIQHTAASTASVIAAEVHVDLCLSGCQGKVVAMDRILTLVFGCTIQRCSGCPGALPRITECAGC